MKTSKKKQNTPEYSKGLFPLSRHRSPEKPSFCCYILFPLALKMDRASSKPVLSTHSTIVLCLPNKDFNEAGLSPRSMMAGKSLDEVCFLTCSFLLPFLGCQIPASPPPPKKKVSYVVLCIWRLLQRERSIFSMVIAVCSQFGAHVKRF